MITSAMILFFLILVCCQALPQKILYCDRIYPKEGKSDYVVLPKTNDTTEHVKFHTPGHTLEVLIMGYYEEGYNWNEKGDFMSFAGWANTSITSDGVCFSGVSLIEQEFAIIGQRDCYYYYHPEQYPSNHISINSSSEFVSLLLLRSPVNEFPLFVNTNPGKRCPAVWTPRNYEEGFTLGLWIACECIGNSTCTTSFDFSIHLEPISYQDGFEHLIGYTPIFVVFCILVLYFAFFTWIIRTKFTLSCSLGCRLCFCEKTRYNHPTMSSASSDANEVLKRAFNILLGIYSYLIATFAYIAYFELKDEIEDKDLDGLMAAFYLSGLGCFFLIGVVIFPGGDHYRVMFANKKVNDKKRILCDYCNQEMSEYKNENDPKRILCDNCKKRILCDECNKKIEEQKICLVRLTYITHLILTILSFICFLVSNLCFRLIFWGHELAFIPEEEIHSTDMFLLGNMIVNVLFVLIWIISMCIQAICKEKDFSLFIYTMEVASFCSCSFTNITFLVLFHPHIHFPTSETYLRIAFILLITFPFIPIVFWILGICRDKLCNVRNDKWMQPLNKDYKRREIGSDKCLGCKTVPSTDEEII